MALFVFYILSSCYLLRLRSQLISTFTMSVPTLVANLKAKTVLVTGASRGLGKALVEALYKQEAVVYALSKNPENLQKLKSEFPKVRTVVADLADWGATRKAVESCGPVDYLVNNAAVAEPVPFLDITAEGFNGCINTNVTAVINVSQVVAQGMIARGKGGSIVNVSTMYSTSSLPGFGVYSTSKAALDMLTRCMSIELGEHNIRVNSVHPSIFLSDMSSEYLKAVPDGGPVFQQRTSLKRFVETSEVVNTILFLLSDYAPMIHGSPIRIDGGYNA